MANRQLLLILVSSIGLLLNSVAAQAEVYRWVDGNGKVHYGDRPPAGAKKREMAVPNAPSESPSDAERRQSQKRLLQSFERDRAHREGLRAEKARNKAKREAAIARCARARDQLTEMKRSAYLYDFDKNGERVVYSHEQRAAATQRLEKNIKQHCG